MPAHSRSGDDTGSASVAVGQCDSDYESDMRSASYQAEAWPSGVCSATNRTRRNSACGVSVEVDVS